MKKASMIVLFLFIFLWSSPAVHSEEAYPQTEEFSVSEQERIWDMCGLQKMEDEIVGTSFAKYFCVNSQGDIAICFPNAAFESFRRILIYDTNGTFLAGYTYPSTKLGRVFPVIYNENTNNWALYDPTEDALIEFNEHGHRVSVRKVLESEENKSYFNYLESVLCYHIGNEQYCMVPPFRNMGSLLGFSKIIKQDLSHSSTTIIYDNTESGLWTLFWCSIGLIAFVGLVIFMSILLFKYKIKAMREESKAKR